MPTPVGRIRADRRTVAPASSAGRSASRFSQAMLPRSSTVVEVGLVGDARIVDSLHADHLRSGRPRSR